MIKNVNFQSYRESESTHEFEFDGGTIMGKVITINNWFDGPMTGLVYFDDIVCIYERVFDEKKDDYIDEYYLTPINDDENAEIMKEWDEWCNAVAVKEKDAYYASHLNNHAIDKILKNSNSKRKFRKKAIFLPGKIEDGWIPIDYNIEWKD